jgi:hypothetical protein
MPRSMFLLARFMLRVDSVVVRLRDVRVWARRGVPYLLLESSVREATFENLAAVRAPWPVVPPPRSELVPVRACVQRCHVGHAALPARVPFFDAFPPKRHTERLAI